MAAQEYTASDIRKILQSLFPARRLVLSQFTLFSQVGIARATGSSSKRGRRCFRLHDILSIAAVLALKEEGISYKNAEMVPAIIQENVDEIFRVGTGLRIIGRGGRALLVRPGQSWLDSELGQSLFSSVDSAGLFWSFDVGLLARQLEEVALGGLSQIQRAA